VGLHLAREAAFSGPLAERPAEVGLEPLTLTIDLGDDAGEVSLSPPEPGSCRRSIRRRLSARASVGGVSCSAGASAAPLDAMLAPLAICRCFGVGRFNICCGWSLGFAAVVVGHSEATGRVEGRRRCRTWVLGRY
jgi:hypothetical protein